MADDERQVPDETRPPLELPSLGSVLRRGKRRRAAPAESAYDDSAPAPAATPPSAPSPVPAPSESADADAEPTPSRHKPTRRGVRVHLPGPVVALLTGAVVGLVLVGLTSAGLKACTAMRGTSSCGNAGILLLLAITLVAIFVGSLLLHLFGVATPGSTSFLGVGLLVVLILIALLPVLDDWWVVVAVPMLAMGTYLVSWWLTTTYVEPGERAR